MSVNATVTDFRAISYPLRLYSGQDALEQLPAELKRQQTSRAFCCPACPRAQGRSWTIIFRLQHTRAQLMRCVRAVRLFAVRCLLARMAL